MSGRTDFYRGKFRGVKEYAVTLSVSTPAVILPWDLTDVKSISVYLTIRNGSGWLGDSLRFATSNQNTEINDDDKWVELWGGINITPSVNNRTYFMTINHGANRSGTGEAKNGKSMKYLRLEAPSGVAGGTLDVLFLCKW